MKELTKGEMEPLKKLEIAIFCMLLISMLSLVGTVAAPNADFTHTTYLSDTEPTVDGTYAEGDEWIASAPEAFGTNGVFRDTWSMGDVVKANLLIETADGTDDPGDYWVVCFDSTEDGGATEPDGGSAPKTNDYKFVVTGHGGAATVQWYKGTGSGWTEIATPAVEVFAQAQSLTPYTPKIGTPHYVLEVSIDKTDTSLGTVIMGYNWGQYVAYYDATSDTTQQWPPAASPDNPDSWGYIVYEFGANPTPDVPEGIGIVALLLTSSVAASGIVLLRKKQRIAHL